MIEIRKMLRAAREHLGLEIAFVSQFVDDRRIYRLVDTVERSSCVREGDGGPIDSSYCRHVVDGRLPGLIRDIGENADARKLPTVGAKPIGAHLSVPVVMSDGTVFGTFCCFGYKPKPSLKRRDLAMLRTFADITAARIEEGILAERSQLEKERRIKALLASSGPDVVYQPVFMLDDLRVAGAEALSRFSHERSCSVDVWFSEAADVGLQIELELLAIRNALRGFETVWRDHRIQLGLNASAATISDRRLWDVLDGYPSELIVMELTEHEEVRSYATLLAAIDRLREHGTKVAVDDVGAGFASMRHVLTLRPEILKLDVGLVRSIDADDLRVALISSLQHFADKFACKVVAEGVETQAELAVLKQLGVQAVQGYLLGRPKGVDFLLDRLVRLDLASDALPFRVN